MRELTPGQVTWLTRFESLNRELEHFCKRGDREMAAILAGFIIDHVKEHNGGNL